MGGRKGVNIYEEIFFIVWFIGTRIPGAGWTPMDFPVQDALAALPFSVPEVEDSRGGEFFEDFGLDVDFALTLYTQD